MNYKICLRHAGKEDNTFLFWKPNGSGYTRCIEEAGIYEDSEENYKNQIKAGDFLVSVDFVLENSKEIQLSKCGDYIDKYDGKNIFSVLPNTGDIRKLLNITIMDFKLDGNRNSFNAYFKSTIKEDFKTKLGKKYVIQGKEDCFNEWWYVNCIIEAENRNKAIEKARHELFLDEYSYLEFKKMITCKKEKEIYFNKWIKNQ